MGLVGVLLLNSTTGCLAEVPEQEETSAAHVSSALTVEESPPSPREGEEGGEVERTGEARQEIVPLIVMGAGFHRRVLFMLLVLMVASCLAMALIRMGTRVRPPDEPDPFWSDTQN